MQMTALQNVRAEMSIGPTSHGRRWIGTSLKLWLSAPKMYW